MIYRIEHKTTYTYDEPVSIGQNVAHLLARPCEWQTWRYQDLAISPVPSVISHRSDYFGNRVTFFSVQESHRTLVVTSRGEVAVRREGNAEPVGGDRAWDAVRDGMKSDLSPAGLEAYQFAFDSVHIRRGEHFARYAEPSFVPGRGLMEATADLTSRIHRDFKFDAKATTPSTSPEEVLRLRRGVCQDFSHLMIACLRTLGLAARYVSGYLQTSAAPGQTRLAGADASHAWVSVYVPGTGWADYDPTNDCEAGQKHITIAWGRDYHDVAPLSGILLGGSGQRISVSVDVTAIG